MEPSAKNLQAINKKSLLKRMWECRILYLFLLPAIVYLILFQYWPMYGIQIAFRNYTISDGFTSSPWVGLKWFDYFVSSRMFSSILRNTIEISLYSLIAGFPMPIILALMLNYVEKSAIRRTCQTIVYMPHFISTIVIVGMISSFFSTSGIVNSLIEFLGGKRTNLMGSARAFKHIYVWTGVWQGMGWSSVIYMAALSSVSPELHEAALIDGANLLQRMRHIDIPAIMPTIVTLLVMSCGGILSVGFEKVYLMQNTMNISESEIISTYVYKQGLGSQKFSYSTAIGLFNSVVNFILLTIVNKVSNRLSGYGMW